MSVITIRNELYTILDAIKVAAGFAAIYKEMPTDIPITPAVAIIVSGGSEGYSSTAKNNLGTNLTVRCMVEKFENGDDDETQTDKLWTLVDSIMAELRKDDNRCLSGSVHSVIFPSFEGIEIGTVGNTIVFYVDIQIQTESFKSITL
jgi:hypothetical protein